MRVEMLVDISGRNPWTKSLWPKRGSEVELPDAQALKLINSGMAKHTAKNEPAIEKAVVEAIVETANKRPRGRPVGYRKPKSKKD